jgi:hypothetical protein
MFFRPKYPAKRQNQKGDQQKPLNTFSKNRGCTTLPS